MAGEQEAQQEGKQQKKEVSHPFLRNLAAGTFCGATVVMSFNPLDCLRIRWQVMAASEGARLHTNDTLWSFSQKIIQTEGLWKGLYRPGLVANGTAASVSVGTRMGVYPFLRDGIIDRLQHQTKHPFVMWFSGLIPGCVGYWVATPLWQVKTRLQAETGLLVNEKFVTGARAGYEATMRGLVDGLILIYKKEGFCALYRGATSIMLRGGMMSSGQFLGYDFTKTRAKSSGVMRDGPVLHVFASTAAAFLSTTFAAPFDIILTRMQSAPTLGRHYDGFFHCVRVMAKEEGPLVFYRGWTVFFSRVAPVFTCLMPFYEQVRLAMGLGYLN